MSLSTVDLPGFMTNELSKVDRQIMAWALFNPTTESAVLKKKRKLDELTAEMERLKR